MIPDPIHPADARKPDPDEPWRYVCPNCRRQVRGTKETTTTKYRCPGCNETFTADELWDKKEEQLAAETRYSTTR